jgi:hypothetical protein
LFIIGYRLGIGGCGYSVLFFKHAFASLVFMVFALVKGVANYLGFTVLIASWAALIAGAIWRVCNGIGRIPLITFSF